MKKGRKGESLEGKKDDVSTLSQSLKLEEKAPSKEGRGRSLSTPDTTRKKIFLKHSGKEEGRGGLRETSRAGEEAALEKCLSQGENKCVKKDWH